MLRTPGFRQIRQRDRSFLISGHTASLSSQRGCELLDIWNVIRTVTNGLARPGSDASRRLSSSLGGPAGQQEQGRVGVIRPWSLQTTPAKPPRSSLPPERYLNKEVPMKKLGLLNRVVISGGAVALGLFAILASTSPATTAAGASSHNAVRPAA